MTTTRPMVPFRVAVVTLLVVASVVAVAASWWLHGVGLDWGLGSGSLAPKPPPADCVALDVLTPPGNVSRAYSLWRGCIEAELAPLPQKLKPGPVPWTQLFPRSEALRRIFGPPMVLATLPDELVPYDINAPLPVTFDDQHVHFPEPGIYRLWTRWGALRVVVPPEDSTAAAGLIWRFFSQEVVHSEDAAMFSDGRYGWIAELTYGTGKLRMRCGLAAEALALLLILHGTPASAVQLVSPAVLALGDADPLTVAQAAMRASQAGETQSVAWGHIVTLAELPGGPCMMDPDFGIRVLEGNRCVGAVELCGRAHRGPEGFAGLRMESLGKQWIDMRFNQPVATPSFSLRAEMRSGPMAADIEAYRKVWESQCGEVRLQGQTLWSAKRP